MKKIIVLLFLMCSPTAWATCSNVFTEDFVLLKIMQVSSARSVFYDANLKALKSFVVKSDLVLTSQNKQGFTCAYYFTKSGSYTAGFLSTQSLGSSQKKPPLDGVWRNDSGANTIRVDGTSFQADLKFQGGNGSSSSSLSGRVLSIASHWRYFNDGCDLKIVIINNIMLVSGGAGCGLAMNTQIQGIYRRSKS